LNLLEFSCCYWHLPALALVTQMVGPSDPAPLHLRTAFAADTAASTIPAKRRSRQNLDAQLSRQNLLPRECGVSATEARFWAELVHVEVGHCPLRWGVEYLRGGRTKRCRAICLKKKKKKKNYAIILFPQRRHDLGQSSCSYKCAIVRCIGLSNTFKGGEKVDEGSFSLQIYICT